MIIHQRCGNTGSFAPSTLEKLPHHKDVGKNIACDIDYIESLDAIILDLEKTVIDSAHYHNRKHYKLLHTMPGVGKITALTVLYETHTVERFKNVQCYSSYCRVVQANNESAGTSYGRTSNDKIGNPYLKWAFLEIGIKMVDQSELIGEWFKKQVAAHGKGVSLLYVKKMICPGYTLWAFLLFVFLR